MAKQQPKATGNTALRQWLESQGYTVKAAPNNSFTVSPPKGQTTVPRDEQRYTSMNAPRSTYTPAPRSPNIASAGYLPPGKQGPLTQAQAQGRPVATTSAPSGSRAVSQPVLAQAAADKIRQQYAAIQEVPGSFMTDTNEGLLNSLRAMGFQPTPVAQWGQVAERLRRNGLVR